VQYRCPRRPDTDPVGNNGGNADTNIDIHGNANGNTDANTNTNGNRNDHAGADGSVCADRHAVSNTFHAGGGYDEGTKNKSA